jgi:hypothetical protein
MGMKPSPAEFAEHLGRIGSSVFAGETWDECSSSLHESWNLVDSGVGWDDALPDIKRGWAAGREKRRHTEVPIKPTDRESSPSATRSGG